MNRAILSLARGQQVLLGEKIGLYSLICVAFMSYPTWVLFRLDSLRPRPDNALAPEVQEEIDARAAARAAK
ncbi:unnamed protein product [Caenorhabditis angaria]|uniref:Uncharacterized protein n=1 Tax=Caenorhabditis angaria TaxID=860376 RepID=A0A9P1IPQ5_9PELO|nr:unnamed protein product [Caenorhabditis angaria]